MRILQLIYESPGSPFGFGGAGVRALEIYRRLQDRHDVTLLCMKYPGARDGMRDGLRYVFVGVESARLTISVLAYTFRAARFVKSQGKNYDVIVENFLPSTPFFCSLLTKTPVILQVQGIMGAHSLKKFSPLYALPMYVAERFYPGLYDVFMFVSPVTRGKVLSGMKGKESRLSWVVPNGINEELLRAEAEEGDYILFFSRIDAYTKGLDILVEAFGRISRSYPGMRLVLAGYEFSSFEKLLSACSPSMRDRIEYAGFVTGDEKVGLLSKARLFVLPSRHESSPVSILEAAACAKPVVVSDIPELQFVEDEGFGVCFRSGSADALVERMELLLKNDELRLRLGRRGREFSRSLLWDSIAAEFERVLEMVASGTGKTSPNPLNS